MNQKRKKMIEDLEGKLIKAPLQIIEGKGGDQESKEGDEDDESIGK